MSGNFSFEFFYYHLKHILNVNDECLIFIYQQHQDKFKYEFLVEKRYSFEIFCAFLHNIAFEVDAIRTVPIF